MSKKIEKSNVEELFELSMVQKGMLYHHLRSENSNVYNVQIALELHGELDISLFQQSLELVQANNEVLRSVFRWEQTTKPLQIILRQCPLYFNYRDLSGHSPKKAARLSKKCKQENWEKRFDLTLLPLRVDLIKISRQKFQLYVAHHHILYDGWSTSIFLQEWFRTYYHLSADRLAYFPKPKYKVLYQGLQAKRDPEKKALFWTDYLSGYSGTPLFEQRSGASDEKATYHTHLDGLNTRMAAFSSTHHVTKASLIYAAYGLLLQKYFDLSDVVFGTTVSDRDVPEEGAEQVMGNFVNTIPLRFRRKTDENLLQLVIALQQALIGRNELSGSSYAEIRELLHLSPNEALFDSAIVIENYPLDQAAINSCPGLSVQLDSARENTSFPLLVNVFFEEELECSWVYQTDLISTSFIEQFARHFKTILEYILDHPEQQTKTISLATPEEQCLLEQFNDTAVAYPLDQTVVQLFEQQVANTPDATAVIYDGQTLTYAELNTRANQVARYLTDAGVSAETLVPICFERSLELMVAITAIHKAGGAYVPIDPEYPLQRIALLLEDIDPKIVLSSNAHIDMLQSITTATCLALDQTNLFSDLPEENLPRQADPAHLAYVIYTSGTTGRPKGVLNQHSGLFNRLLWMADYLSISPEDVILQKTTYCFDVSVWELILPLIRGASLVLAAPNGHKDHFYLQNLIQKEGITVIHFVPSMLTTFLADVEPEKCTSLKHVICSGEALNSATVEDFSAKLSPVKIHNLYGPTEAAIDVTAIELDAADHSLVPIGRPIANTQIYIVDQDKQLCPPGVAGELLIGGIQVARGYLNRPDLTREKFIVNPFSTDEASRLYRTGDMARWLPGGQIEYLGRLDHQIKIRGQRIELGEIESHLLSHQQIREAAVAVKLKGNEPYLIGYYASTAVITREELDQFLAIRLPTYMLPAQYIPLEKLPLSANGKLDRRALPEPDFQNEVEYLAPITPLERRLSEIWADILELPTEKIGINHNFFRLGGHSLKAMQLVGRIQKELSLTISVNDVFGNASITQLAKRLNSLQTTLQYPIIRSNTKDYYPLSPAQERMYFLQILHETSTAYNMFMAFALHGDLDRARLERAFAALIQRHESLRTAFLVVNDRPVQQIADSVDFSISCIEATDQVEIQSLIHSFIRPFDLSSSPLLRAGLIKTAVHQHIMIVDMHHIISDGVSLDILTRDFMDLYAEKALPTPLHQYRDYSEWLHSEAIQSKIDKERIFWLSEYDHTPQPLDLPLDFVRPKTPSHQGAFIQFELTTEQTAQLLGMADRHGATLYMIMLSIYNILLGKLSRHDDIVIGTPIADRPHADLDGVIGMFVNTLAIRNYPEKHRSFSDFLQAVKSKVLACFDHASYPYEDLVEQLSLSRDTNRNPLFDCMLVFQNFRQETLAIPGIRLEPYPTDVFNSKFDLTLIGKEVADRLELTFAYATDLFRRETVERIACYFRRITEIVLQNPLIRLEDIDILPEDEKNLLLNIFNDTMAPLPTNTNLVDLFLNQVKTTPDRTALIFEQECLTYRQLNEKANAIARIISERTDTGQRIGLLFQPSTEMVAAIWGVLKAGCAYVPLSPESPHYRNTLIMQDCGVSILLIQEALCKSSAEQLGLLPGGEQVIIQSGLYEPTETYRKVDETAEAYVIYTSGTTGQPKGVPILHRSLLNYVLWSKTHNELTEQDVRLQMVPYHFDGFGANFYPILIIGGSMVLISREKMLCADHIVERLRREKVTSFGMLPGLYSALLDQIALSGPLPNLHFVLLAGERASAGLLAKSRDLLPNVRIDNEYGPTESTIGITHQKDMEVATSRLIGKPIWNTQIYILNEGDQLAPLGVTGELCVSGVGLSTGYLNNEVLNAEKFTKHPFLSDRKIYRTGDLARWLPNGAIELAGRIDEQVKIRGHRIETAEIELHLGQYKSVKEVVVSTITLGGSTVLVAYFTAGEEIASEDLREFLMLRLPDYMVPFHFIQMDHFPFTRNGKIDKKSLPEPREANEQKPIAASTDEEKILVDVWSAVLGRRDIGVNDNFFAIGGDSIKSIQISSRLRGLGYHLSVRDIFQEQQICRLALRMKVLQAPSEQRPVEGYIPLTPIQQWFFSNDFADGHHFNQSILINFKAGVDFETVQKIFTELAAHHDTLRIVFQSTQEGILQHNLGTIPPISIAEYFLDDDPDPEGQVRIRIRQIQSGIDLENGPLFQLGLFHLRGSSRLFITIHHLVVDGVSWRILFEDINRLYVQSIQGEAFSLPLKTDTYHKWSHQLLKYSNSINFERSESYWQSAATRLNELVPRDFSAGSNTFGEVSRQEFVFSEEQTASLLHQAPKAFGTQINDLLLTALLLTLDEFYGLKGIRLDLEGHGREAIYPGTDVSRTVGWFTSIYPVYLEMQQGALSDLIKYIKESLRAIPNKGIDFLIREYRRQEDDLHPKTKKMDHAQINFNYLGQFEAEAEGAAIELIPQTELSDIAPVAERPYDWDISGMIRNGRLAMGITFSTQQYRKETIAELVDLYRLHLLQLISYCTNYGSVELTPSDLSYNDLSISQVAALQQSYDLQNIYPLTPMQEGMLFHSLMEPVSGNYFSQMSISLTGELKPEALEKSLHKLTTSYDILRSVFLHQGLDHPIQVVLKEPKVRFIYQDLTAECSIGSKENVLQTYLEKDRADVFDLGASPLLRVSVLKTGETAYELVWSHHHILMDGWCIGIVFRDLLHYYDLYCRQEKISLRPVNSHHQYLQWLKNLDRQAMASFWCQYLTGYHSLAGLPAGYISSKTNTYKGRSKLLSLDSSLSKGLNRLSQQLGITTSTILQTAWGLLLQRYNDTDDVVFGSVVAGRPPDVAEIETMVGLFINTVPVRIKAGAADTVGTLLQRVQDSALEAEAHHYMPLYEIQSKSDAGRRLLDHIMVFENYPVSSEVARLLAEEESETGLKFANVRFFEQTNYDICVVVMPGDSLKIRIDFNANHYRAKTIQNVLKHLQYLLIQMSEDVSRPVRDLTLLNASQRRDIWQQAVLAAGPQSFNQTVLDLFRLQVKATPNHTALICADRQISYLRLEQLTNQMAHYLRTQHSLNKGMLAGITLERSEWLIAAILAIWKTGAAYVPIDPSYPKARISYIMDHCRCSLTIDEDLLSDFQHQADNYPLQWAERGGTTDEMAYVMYTSGSTGQPKGVQIEHRSLVNYITWADRTYVLGEAVNFPFFTSLGFDLTLTSIFTPLIAGNTVIIYPEGPGAAILDRLLTDNKVEVVKLTPSHLELLKDAPHFRKAGYQSRIRRFIVGGEELTTKLAYDIHQLFEGAIEIYNEYGPTEATVGCMIYRYDPARDRQRAVPIGVAIENNQVVILDKHLQPVPEEVTGELYIAGVGLSTGYWNNESLNSERFLPKPDGSKGRLYKTGDLARMLPDGNLEFIGRVDQQIKIRGFRIELGEIEALLLKHKAIQQCAAVVGEKETGKQIVVYYVSDLPLPAAGLVEYLSERLPEYMIPDRFIHLLELPLNQNGKLDRKALAELKPEQVPGEGERPSGETGEKLLRIWSEILTEDEDFIGARSNFFSIGGHSLKAMRLVNRISSEFKVEIPIREIFRLNTIDKQAEYIDNERWARSRSPETSACKEEFII